MGATMGRVKGYFGIGVERISKPMNLGSLLRTAHAFGASFAFTIAADVSRREAEHADTSKALAAMPLYEFATVADVRLPEGCKLVGLEFTDAAIELPVFVHPRMAAYVLGAERFGLSAELLDCCDHVVRIPTRFSINLAIAGALAMYDRTISLGRYRARGAASAPALPVLRLPLARKGRVA